MIVSSPIYIIQRTMEEFLRKKTIACLFLGMMVTGVCGLQDCSKISYQDFDNKPIKCSTRCTEGTDGSFSYACRHACPGKLHSN